MVAENAVLASRKKALAAFSLQDGKAWWETSFPEEIIYWGIAVDREGRILATLLDGSVVCLGEGGAPLKAAPPPASRGAKAGRKAKTGRGRKKK